MSDSTSGARPRHGSASRRSPRRPEDADGAARNGGGKRPNGLHVHGPTGKVCKKLVEDFIRKFCRGFASGAGLYAGVQIVSSLLRNPFRDKLPGLWQAILSKDCARVATFFGLYPSIYHLMVDLLTIFRAQKDGWTYGVSGGVAGLAAAILHDSMRKTLAFFTLSRALGAGVSTLVTRGHLSAIPFFEVGVFSACVSAIIYCTARKPEYLTTGYYRSILKWSRDYTDEKLATMFRIPGPHFVTCEEVGVHEGSCWRHSVVDLLYSLPSFAKLYLPIHVTPILVFKRKTLLQRPLYVLQSLTKNMVWSTLFLGAMVFLCKGSLCVFRNLTRLPPPGAIFIPVLAGAISGLALLMERFSRRKELTMFVIPHVLNIAYLASKHWGLRDKLTRIPHAFTLTFALSMATIMHAFEREPESLTLLINGLLRFFVGTSSRSPKTLDTVKSDSK